MSSTLVISLDFELGWGVLDSNLWRERQAAGVYTRLRKLLPIVLRKLKNLSIPTTWAVVAGMGIEDSSELELAHLPDGYRNAVQAFLNEASWETRCGIDLIAQLIDLSGLCEISTHTATHIHAGYPSITSDSYLQDIRQSVTFLESITGNVVRSIVFPRDQADFRADLARELRMNMRLNPNYNRNTGRYYRLTRGAARLVADVPSSKVILGASGETYQTGSMYFNWIGGSYEGIKKMLLMRDVKLLNKQLATGNDAYHVWLHPFNLAESDQLYQMFSDWLDGVARLRDKGLVEVVSMADLGDYCRGKTYGLFNGE